MYQRNVMPMQGAELPGMMQLPARQGMGMPPMMQLPAMPQEKGADMMPLMGMLGAMRAKPEGGTSLLDLIRGQSAMPPSAGQSAGVLGLQPGFLTDGLMGAGGSGAIGLPGNFLTSLLGFG
jgi:hypothetical protein